jgi:hypothetical protein
MLSLKQIERIIFNYFKQLILITVLIHKILLTFTKSPTFPIFYNNYIDKFVFLISFHKFNKIFQNFIY